MSRYLIVIRPDEANVFVTWTDAPSHRAAADDYMDGSIGAGEIVVVADDEQVARFQRQDRPELVAITEAA